MNESLLDRPLRTCDRRRIPAEYRKCLLGLLQLAVDLLCVAGPCVDGGRKGGRELQGVGKITIVAQESKVVEIIPRQSRAFRAAVLKHIH